MDTQTQQRSKRHKHKHRRRRHSSSDSDDEEEESGFATWKTMAVLGIIAVCFAILYPKMFHPMLMYVLNGPAPKTDDDAQSFPHPSMRGRGPPPNMAGKGKGDRPPPPGMRQGMGGETGGSGKRSWQWMMPIYTIGVVAFLLYTLSKILWKKPAPGARRAYNLRYNTDRSRFEVPGAPGSSDSESESEDLIAPQPGQLKRRELKTLQKRLMNTESSMQKILEQLEGLQGNVDEATADAIRKETMENLTNIASTEEKAKKIRQRAAPESSESDSDLSSEDDSKRKRNKRKSKAKNNTKEGTTQYLGDLEKALSDFRSLTETYVQQKANEIQKKAKDETPDADKADDEEEEEQNEPSTSKTVEVTDNINSQSDEETSEQVKDKRREDLNEADLRTEVDGFDAMECEDSQDMSMPEPVGTLTAMKGDGFVAEEHTEGKKVRKRRAKKAD